MKKKKTIMKKNIKGYIKLHRQILYWEWWDDPKVFKVFMYCLLRANHTDQKWKGIDIKRGEFITSTRILATQCHLSLRSIRTVLKHLKSTHELTCKTTHRYTIICVLKYDEYQSETTQSTTQSTTQQRHSPDTVPTTDKNVLKNALKNDKETKHTHAKIKSTDDSHVEIDYFSRAYKRKFYDIKTPPYCHSRVWCKWIDHRWNMNKPYKTLNGAQTDMNDLEKMFNETRKPFHSIVDKTIGMEWIHFHPFNDKNNDNDNNPNESIVPDDISQY